MRQIWNLSWMVKSLVDISTEYVHLQGSSVQVLCYFYFCNTKEEMMTARRALDVWISVRWGAPRVVEICALFCSFSHMLLGDESHLLDSASAEPQSTAKHWSSQAAWTTNGLSATMMASVDCIFFFSFLCVLNYLRISGWRWKEWCSLRNNTNWFPPQLLDQFKCKRNSKYGIFLYLGFGVKLIVAAILSRRFWKYHRKC